MSYDPTTKQIELELHSVAQGVPRFSFSTHSKHKLDQSCGSCSIFRCVPHICVSPSAPVEPGKFDLVYQNPDGTERVEYAVSRDSRV